MAKFKGKQWLKETASKLKLKQLQLKLRLKNWKDKETVDRKRSIQPLTTWMKKYKYKIIGGIGAVGLSVTICVAGYHHIQSNTFKVYHVKVGDEVIGSVSDPAIIEQYIEQKHQKLAADYPDIHMELEVDDIIFTPETAYKIQSDDDAAVAELEKHIATYAVGAEIRVDGELIGVVKDQETADRLLAQIKESYVTPSAEDTAIQALAATDADDVNVKPNVEVESVEFVEEVEVGQVETNPQAILDEDEVLEKLQDGEVKGTVYVVEEGDCVSCIAQKLGVSQEYIYSKNPEVKDELLQIGQELDLTEFVPDLSVRTVEKREEIHEVQFETIYEKDDSLNLGMSEVLQEGEPGKKLLTLRVTKLNGEETGIEIVDEEVLVEPTPKVVRQGTKVVAGVGSGTFRWPVVSAIITSGYGMRWGSMHKGLDMVSSNRNVMAADSGTVTFAGSKSSYGNLVIIDHGNGYETYYAHLSKINVSAGTKLEKGDVLGVMGMTGNATGVHLHFEVHKDGTAQNPFSYLDS